MWYSDEYSIYSIQCDLFFLDRMNIQGYWMNLMYYQGFKFQSVSLFLSHGMIHRNVLIEFLI